jgi:hypothetical protein
MAELHVEDEDGYYGYRAPRHDGEAGRVQHRKREVKRRELRGQRSFGDDVGIQPPQIDVPERNVVNIGHVPEGDLLEWDA